MERSFLYKIQFQKMFSTKVGVVVLCMWCCCYPLLPHSNLVLLVLSKQA